MKIFRIVAVVLLALGSPAAAQAADSPKPTEPVVRRAPTNSAWTIELTYADEVQKGSLDTPPIAPMDRLKSISITKTVPTYCEVFVWGSGKREEKWTMDNIQLRTMPGTDAIVPTYAPLRDLENPGQSLRDPNYSDYSQSDFQGLEWVRLANYQGVKSYAGTPVFYFETTIAGRPHKAYLTIETQLPLYSVDGATTCIYKYLSPPAAPLVPPAGFLRVFKAHKDAMRAQTRRPIR
jgi:hypothetical protein